MQQSPPKNWELFMFTDMQDSALEVLKTALLWQGKRSNGIFHANFRCVLSSI